MRAFVVPQPGANTVEMAQVSIPRIDDDEVLVHVRAVGVGIHDSYFLPAGAPYPLTIGIEGAGEIEEIGAAVQGHRVGDRVAFVSSMQPKGGTWAEYAAVKVASLILPIPAGMDFVAAAAIPVAGNTALKALSALTGVPKNGSLFIAGGSGAIGTFAIQLARQRGWRVAASASKANHEYMASLGAGRTVDYHDSQWREEVREWMPGGVDAAMAVQPGTSADSLPVVKDGGELISISGDELVPERGVRTMGIPYQEDVRAELVHLMKQIAAGDIHLEIERVVPFESALDALEKVRTRHTRGKLVLRLA